MFYVLRSAAVVAVLGAWLCMAGCKATEAQPAGFIQNPELMKRDGSIPFQRSYWNKKYEKSSYAELLIAPVNTDYVMAQNLWEKTSGANLNREQVKKDIAALADYTRNAFVRAAADDPKKRLTVVDEAGPRTAILELAIVQVVPSKAALNALGYVSLAPTAIMYAGAVGTESQDTGKGYVAIEGRIRDGATGEIIASFADREAPRAALVDLKSLTWWSPAKAIIDDWARQFIQLANRRPGEVVKDSPSFDLLVW